MVLNLIMSLLCLYLFSTTMKSSIFYINRPERWDLFLPFLSIALTSLIISIILIIRIIKHFNLFTLFLIFSTSYILFSIGRGMNIDSTDFQNEVTMHIVFICIIISGHIISLGKKFIRANCMRYFKGSHIIWKKLQVTSSICKKRADGCNLNINNIAALVRAED